MSSQGNDPSKYSLAAVVAHHLNLGEDRDDIREWYRRERAGSPMRLLEEVFEQAEEAAHLSQLYRDLADDSILADIFSFGGAPQGEFEVRFNVRVQDQSGIWEWRPVIVDANAGMTKAELMEKAIEDGREMAQKGVGLGGRSRQQVAGEEAVQVAGIFVD